MSDKFMEETILELCSKVKCSKCANIFSELKTLPCSHVFCKSPCLEELAALDPEGKTLQCPVCNCKASLPEIGVAGLPNEFQNEYFRKQKEALEKAKDPQYENCQQPSATKCIDDKSDNLHQTREGFNDRKPLKVENRAKPNTVEVTAPAKEQPTNKEHTEMKLKERCSDLTCSDGSMRSHKRRGSELVTDLDEYQQHQAQLQSHKDTLSDNLEHIDQALRDLEARDNEISSQSDMIKATIKREIQELKDTLNNREHELIHILNDRVIQRHQQIASRIKEIKAIQSEIKSFLHSAKIGLEAESEEGLIIKPILKPFKGVIAMGNSKHTQPSSDSEIELVTDDRAQEVCREFGNIVCNPISPENCHATVMDIPVSVEDRPCPEFAVMDTQASVEVHPVTKTNKKSKEKNFRLKAELEHVKSGATFKCDTNQQNGQHTVTYRPVLRGAHKLHIKVNGDHIKGSPYPVVVIPSPQIPYYRVIKLGKDCTKPHSIAVNSRRDVLVTEQSPACVSMQNLRKEKRSTFGNQIILRVKLRQPRGITVDEEDNIFVVDKDRVLKYNSQGVFQRSVGDTGNGDLQFNQPVGICFNKTSQLLYVCDQRNHRIQMLTTDLTFVDEIGESGADEGKFNCPLNLAFDSNNYLYVTDSENNRIQVFTAVGNFVRTFTQKANGLHLECPNAIAIDSSDTVYVSEKETAYVSMFTAQGKFFASFGQDREFTRITGLAVDHHDQVLVSDYKSNRLQIF